MTGPCALRGSGRPDFISDIRIRAPRRPAAPESKGRCGRAVFKFPVMEGAAPRAVLLRASKGEEDPYSLVVRAGNNY